MGIIMSPDLTSSPAGDTLLIIGYGMATARLLNRLADRGYPGPICVVSRENIVGYNRIQLTPWLANPDASIDLNLVNPKVMSRLNIRLLTQTDVVSFSADLHQARLSDGSQLSFAQAVFATGAQPLLPACDFKPQPAIRAFRTLNDGHFLRALPKRSRVAVVGGGLLGLEAAWGLGQLGHQVTLIHRNSHLLNRQLSHPLASLLANTFIKAGIELRLNSQVSGIDSDPLLTSITLNTDETLPVRCLIAAAGIRPNNDLGQQSVLATAQGIQVNAALQTSAGHIFAIGECTEFAGQTFGLVAPVYAQAEVLAQRLMGGSAEFAVSHSETRLKISGLDVFSTGQISHPKTQVLSLVDHHQQRGRTLHLLNNQLIGAELLGDLSLANYFNDLIRTQCPINDNRELLLGRLQNAA
ncbi:NAD(P)/FAD-dependent oxidoreductase [Reinekea sp.]|uniref:NAD(P)/FAD-dependent oxidoreductase n=1 Tax=Reinekea sp. TaxID=1970455 RepID=UPI002A7FB632|nr:FAD-dependent oxidoreductase [Reinekea sp.]